MPELSMDAYWQLAPFARTYATITFVLSFGIYTGMIPGYYFLYYNPAIWAFPPQLWRLVSSFMITGPQLGMLFDTFFIYTYMSQLEQSHFRGDRREDLIWYLIFNGATIVALTHLTGFMTGAYTSALILSLAYTVTQEQRGGMTNYMFFTIPTQLVPYAMLLINLFFPGGVQTLILQAHGLVSAHLYLFLTKIWPQIAGGRNWLQTPAFLATLVGGGSPSGAINARAVAASRQGNTPTSARASGVSLGSGPLPDSWRTRGPGHRLG